MSKSMVCKVISELLDIFESHIGQKWIKLEKTIEEKNTTKEAFFRTGGIPGVIGCVDGTHVKIKAPGSEINHLYYNRKEYYSIYVILRLSRIFAITQLFMDRFC
ncbi:putative nuclease HARBI1 [Lucilia cuprina]|nr:putative nuclease HARBI1 [Lucilia cuprina]